jgi:DNA-binding transcriptional regulator GbsR (MarR family)
MGAAERQSHRGADNDRAVLRALKRQRKPIGLSALMALTGLTRWSVEGAIKRLARRRAVFVFRAPGARRRGFSTTPFRVTP